MMRRLLLLSFSIPLVLPHGSPRFALPPGLRASPQDAVALVSRTQAIPKGFKTYSLFLICNPTWLDPARNSGLLQLYRQFLSFGRAIGDDQAALWFWNSSSFSSGDTDLARIVDVERSVRFCKAWKLKPSEGPHLVITSSYPDEGKLSAGLPANSAVYKLGDMTPTDISSLLAKLTDSLVETGKVPVAASGIPAPGAAIASAAPPDSLWVRLLTATQQTINGFGCAWSFKINAGPVSADLKSCKTN
jgi:hypothetical protein